MRRLAIRCLLALSLVAVASTARAQGKGFATERYEPTPAGEWTFAVDHPWYTRGIQFFAGGLTLDYAHNSLVFGTDPGGGSSFNRTSQVIDHSLTGHVDLAASFLDRVLVNFSLPVTLLERGTNVDGVSPLSGAAVGDPRLGAMVRLYGQPLRDAFSIHLGIDFWIPVKGSDTHAGDSTLRVLPKLVLAGLAKEHLSWSFLAGYQYRTEATIGSLPPSAGNTVGSELHFGLALAYADIDRRFSIGPEANLATVVTNSHAFDSAYTSGEIILGINYNIVKLINIGVAGGIGLGHEPGTPDGRVILRLAYAPWRANRPSPAPVVEVVVVPADRDHDDVLDRDDVCPDVPKGDHPDPDPARHGCPLKDTDGDGVFDPQDQCVTVPQGDHPDKNKPGCPDVDSDGDGVYDSYDECKDVPAGLHPDPAHPGCPLPDRDHDMIPDETDACPDKPGAPNVDPKKNGCPGLVQIKDGQIVILTPVYFATNKDVILARSFPVLEAVASALVATPSIKRVGIEGHTDDRGKLEHNMDLSDRRARSVLKFLVDHGVETERLEAKGFGPTRPIRDNRTNAGRAVNRRVEFHIIDGTGAASVPPPAAPSSP